MARQPNKHAPFGGSTWLPLINCIFVITGPYTVLSIGWQQAGASVILVLQPSSQCMFTLCVTNQNLDHATKPGNLWLILPMVTKALTQERVCMVALGKASVTFKHTETEETWGVDKERVALETPMGAGASPQPCTGM